MAENISVIIPVYRVEKYLRECIESVIHQTEQNLEIILVDDGSPDQCPEICDEYAKKDPRIKVIHKENGGLSDARNAGLDICTGNYISFVDSDDWIAPDMLERLLNILLKENADIACCGITNFYEGENRKEEWTPEYTAGTAETFYHQLYKTNAFPVAAWNKLYKRECWEKLRFPKGKICEDAFTTYLLLDQANKIVQIPEPLYFYRIRENSIMTKEFNPSRMDEEEAWRRNYEFMKEHYPSVYKEAFSFYLQKVNVLIHTIPEDKYPEEYQKLYGILKRNKNYLLFQSGLSWKYKAKFLLDYRKLGGNI